MVSGSNAYSEQSCGGVAQRGHGQQLVPCASVEQVGRAQWFVTADMVRCDKGGVKAGG